MRQRSEDVRFISNSALTENYSEKVRSFTQERQCRLEEEGDRGRVTQRCNEGERSEGGKGSERRKEIAEISAAVREPMGAAPRASSETAASDGNSKYTAAPSHTLCVSCSRVITGCDSENSYHRLVRLLRSSA